MSSTTLSEHVALIATRAEWAKIANLLGSIPPCNVLLQDNPEFAKSLRKLANNGINIQATFDALSVINIDTQLRMERNAPVESGKVKIIKTENTMRPAWEPSNEVKNTY